MKANPEQQLARVLQALFTAQARDVASKASLDQLPDLGNWLPVMAQAAKPHLVQLWRQGMVEAARRIQRLQEGDADGDEGHEEASRQAEEAESQAVWQAAEGAAGEGLQEPVAAWHPSLRPGLGTKSLRAGSPRDGDLLLASRGDGGSVHPIGKSSDYSRHWHRSKALSQVHSKALGWAFNLFNPKVEQAVDQATFSFCQATNATALGDLAEALQLLRVQMREGLSRGEAQRVLAKRVLRIFADPVRAWRIAVTEGSRATHLGGIMAARESGLVGGKRWLASSDACGRCQELNYKEVGLEEPFVILPGGGPYAVVLAPPLHPGCFCTFTEVLLPKAKVERRHIKRP